MTTSKLADSSSWEDVGTTLINGQHFVTYKGVPRQIEEILEAKPPLGPLDKMSDNQQFLVRLGECPAKGIFSEDKVWYKLGQLDEISPNIVEFYISGLRINNLGSQLFDMRRTLDGLGVDGASSEKAPSVKSASKRSQKSDSMGPASSWIKVQNMENQQIFKMPLVSGIAHDLKSSYAEKIGRSPQDITFVAEGRKIPDKECLVKKNASPKIKKVYAILSASKKRASPRALV